MHSAGEYEFYYDDSVRRKTASKDLLFGLCSIFSFELISVVSLGYFGLLIIWVDYLVAL